MKPTRPTEGWSEKWHYRFLEVADCIAGWSKDPSRGVGCVIVSPSKQIISTGFNGLPRGVEDDRRWHESIEKSRQVYVEAGIPMLTLPRKPAAGA